MGRMRCNRTTTFCARSCSGFAALAEKYVLGVSTRNVKAIPEELCGYEFSADVLSPIHQKLDEDSPYRILDARYEKVREDGVIHIFPPETRGLRGVRAWAVEPHEEWLEGARSLEMQPLCEPRKEKLTLAA